MQGRHEPLQELLPGQALLLRGLALQLPGPGQVGQEGGQVVVLAGLPALGEGESSVHVLHLLQIFNKENNESVTKVDYKSFTRTFKVVENIRNNRFVV